MTKQRVVTATCAWLTPEMKTKKEIVEVNVDNMKALHDSVTEETYDYLVNKGRKEALKEFWEWFVIQ